MEFVFVACRQQVDVARCTQAGVTAAADGRRVGQILSGLNGQAVASADEAAVVDKGAHAAAITHSDGGTIVDDIALECRQFDLIATDFAGQCVANAVGGHEFDTLIGFHQTALIEAALDVDGHVVAGLQCADVDQIATGQHFQISALNQAATAHVARLGLRQIQHRHQHFLAVDDALFHPDNVVGQRSDLRRGQADAD